LRVAEAEPGTSWAEKAARGPEHSTSAPAREGEEPASELTAWEQKHGEEKQRVHVEPFLKLDF